MRHRYVKGERKRHSAEKKSRCKGPGAGMCLVIWGSNQESGGPGADRVLSEQQPGSCRMGRAMSYRLQAGTGVRSYAGALASPGGNQAEECYYLICIFEKLCLEAA